VLYPQPMARLRVLTISEADEDIEDSGEPLIVCRVDDATIRKVVLVLLEQLAPTATVVPLHVATPTPETA